MFEGLPLMILKMLGFSAGIMIFIRFFARRTPRENGGPQTTTPAHLPANRKLGDYLVLETIGIGGNATVYKAKSPQGDLVAIKVPHLEAIRQKGFRAAFQAEAEAGVDLVHPSIVKVLGTGQFTDSGGRSIPFFVMEYLEGEDLSHRLRDCGRLEASEAAQIARAVADALAWAHRRGVQHRDISPKNIFLTTNKRVKVMDFGISTLFQRGSFQSIPEGPSFGTPHYLAPERTSNTTADPRSDLYSLGCVLYEMLVGKPPFDAENLRALLMLHRKQPAPPPSTKVKVPQALEDIVMKLLEKDPNQRYQDAAQVTAALADLQPAT